MLFRSHNIVKRRGDYAGTARSLQWIILSKAFAKLILKVGTAPIFSGSYEAIVRAGLVPVIFLNDGTFNP